MTVLGHALTWTHAVFAGALVFMALARVAELVVARRLTAKAKGRGAAPAREPIFVVMVVLHVLPFVLAPLEVVLLERPFLPALAIVSGVALALAFALRVWTLTTLGANWNVRIVQPGQVITSGPYRFIRHPNYAVVITELLFLPLVHTAWMTCLAVTVLNAFVLARRIPAEERVLFAQPGYEESFADKARFLPGVV